MIIELMEVLYYSLFMKFTYKRPKIHLFITGFSILSIGLALINTNNLYVYYGFGFAIFIMLKHLLKIETTNYDILPILVCLVFKGIIEMIVYVSFYKILDENILMIMLGTSKTLLLLISNFKLNYYYLKYKNKWEENHFYTRWITTILFIIWLLISLFYLLSS